jgi:hypothetical protein
MEPSGEFPPREFERSRSEKEDVRVPERPRDSSRVSIEARLDPPAVRPRSGAEPRPEVGGDVVLPRSDPASEGESSLLLFWLLVMLRAAGTGGGGAGAGGEAIPAVEWAGTGTGAECAIRTVVEEGPSSGEGVRRPDEVLELVSECSTITSPESSAALMPSSSSTTTLRLLPPYDTRRPAYSSPMSGADPK